MPNKKRITVGLVGNPNAGKSSIFNLLTGLRQHTANFPGVTVDKKIGVSILPNGEKADILDLPGCYSLYPNTSDEKVVLEVLTNPQNEDYPDLVVYVADVTHLERHLLFATQLHDMGLPMILAINMIDTIEEESNPKLHLLEQRFGSPTIGISGKTGEGLAELKQLIQNQLFSQKASIKSETFCKLTTQETTLSGIVSAITGHNNDYQNLIVAHHSNWLHHLSQDQKTTIDEAKRSLNFESVKMQIQETMARFTHIQPIVAKVVSNNVPKSLYNYTDRLDNILTNKYLGPFIFFLVNFLIFNAVFSWAQYPMEWIENGFANAGNYTRYVLGQGWLSDLIVDGILAGLSGVLIFIPQIFILFLLIAILEESGYMSRAVYMFDNIMRKFGLNGRSMVALISSGACAVPAIMSTRTIGNWKERITTIMVAPLISCSARLPVYALLVGFVVPLKRVWGFINLQGMVFMGLYLIGIISSLLVAYVFSRYLKDDTRSHLMIELPQYKPPSMKNVLYSVKDKVWAFVVNAGKIIMIISILLWILASFGPEKQMIAATEKAKVDALSKGLSPDEAANLEASYRLEASFAGVLGKTIEPAIKPLGFDWKIGIALITSFAAREVFVGTMATIYSVGSEEDDKTIRQKMADEKRTGSEIKVYTPATAMSLLVFYVFAMQCMSTLAVTKKETGSWKWPGIQLLYMSALAYFSSLFVFQIFGP